jgi:outer membrane protein TolC
MKKSLFILLVNLTLILPFVVFAQANVDTIVTLKQCVDYALRNQPAVRQASIDQQINEKDINIGLSAWLPQISSADIYQYYFKGTPAAVALIPGGTGSYTSPVNQYSVLGLQASQVVYNNDVLQAAKAAKYSRLYYQQNKLSSQINVVADVSKAFFDVLLSQKQLDILNQDVIRLQRSLKDAYDKYKAGTTDKTDYKQATISLNNSIAERKQTAESINSKLAYLKQIMGISANHNLELAYDSSHFEQAAYIDTNQKLDVNNRIEYRLLMTQKNLLNVNVLYYKLGFLPSLSANGIYNWNYLSNRFSNLYNQSYPSSYAGLTLDIPIFQGTKRLQNLSKARLQVDRTDLDIVNSENTINTEYVQALADYKSSYANWAIVKQNVDLAQDVYKVVTLQYREGIKTYTDLIVAQSSLRTAQLSYYNALFQLLSSKVDLEKSLGILAVPQ